MGKARRQAKTIGKNEARSRQLAALVAQLSALTHTEFLSLTGLPRKTVHDYALKGMHAYKGRDSWSLVEYLKWARERVGTHRRPADGKEGENNKLRLERIKADRAELELRQLNGDIEAEYQAKFGAYCGEICAVFIAQPRHLALRLVGKTAAEIETEIAAYNEQQVIQLSQAKSTLPTEVLDQIRALLAVEEEPESGETAEKQQGKSGETEGAKP